MVLKDFAVPLVCLVMLLPKGNAANISQVVVHAGQTADIYYHRSANETSEGFRSYRVSKNMVSFSYIADGSSTGNCTEGVLKMFCIQKTSFYKYNGSHLLLQIKETELNDTGSYEVHAVFKKLDRNFVEQILLKVIRLKIHEKTTIPPSVRSTAEQNQSTASSTTAPSVVNSASFPCTFSMARVLLLLLFYYLQ